ncbi:pirin family protein [Heterostelium album PN500]|uniref:Pirin family protein n=1 Tax=Heterostelium pallidum (strain ATCC 26659 / Pp 5 / PN500) TaxID=670386 RepID=D3BM71_HETP5|nr:pirin family protein [Heterostelium album PN500]EFA77672.1 pirin family protein [Heterostelium album PN500]|eukprot:XP_020429800.1 pirin family protein [Heterostelium album PN500]
MTSRIVSKIANGIATSDGAGVKLKRIIGGSIASLDPFLMLDEFRNDNPNDYMAGFPEHPHRGFETVTYMIEGSFEHKDNKGNRGLLTPGSVQWMTAGRGIVHSEMPKQDKGLVFGYQLWVNLPAKDKMIEPRYQDIPPSKIPVVKEVNGNQIKVIAGNYKQTRGPVDGIVTDPLYLDVTIASAQSFVEEIPTEHTSFAYVFEGSGFFGPKGNMKKVEKGQIAILDASGGKTQIEVTSDGGCRFLLVAGKPIKERVVQHGPFCIYSSIQVTLQTFRIYSHCVGMNRD